MRGRLFAERYQLLCKIGGGSQGTVYRARHVLLDQPVALKILKSTHTRSRGEGRLAAALRHPAFVRIYDGGFADDAEFIAMELLEGHDLGIEIAQGPMPQGRAVTIAIEIADGLRFAHARAIVHRDVKPANIFVCSDGAIKILDLGLALRVPAASSECPAGSVPYMAPECLTGGVIDTRTDQYALAVILFQMLAGHHPYADGANLPSRAEIVKRVRQSSPPPSSSGICPELYRVVAKALRVDPDRRFRDMAEFAMTLGRFASAPVGYHRRPSSIPPPTKIRSA